MSTMRAAIHLIGLSAQIWLWCRVDQCLSLAKDIGRRWYVYLPFVVAYGWALDHVRINVSHSLPYTLVYVEHAPRDLRRGDLVVYRFAGGEDGQYADLSGAPFFKRIPRRRRRSNHRRWTRGAGERRTGRIRQAEKPGRRAAQCHPTRGDSKCAFLRARRQPR